MHEAFRDPKTWLFALLSFAAAVPSSVGNQRQIIVSSLGFSPFQVTLLGCVDGIIIIIANYTGTWLIVRLSNSRCYVAVAYTIPDIIAILATNFLPWSNKIGLLSQWTAGNSLFREIMHSAEICYKFCMSSQWHGSPV